MFLNRLVERVTTSSDGRRGLQSGLTGVGRRKSHCTAHVARRRRLLDNWGAKNNKMSSSRPQCKKIPIPVRLDGGDWFRGGQVKKNRAKGSIDSFSIEMCMTYWMELTNLVIRVNNNPRFRSKRRRIASFRWGVNCCGP